MSGFRFDDPQEEIRCYEGVVEAVRRMRPHVEDMRREAAAANDLAQLLAIASVADQVDEWERVYAARVSRLYIKHKRTLRGAGRSPADKGHGWPASAVAGSAPRGRGEAIDAHPFPVDHPTTANPLEGGTGVPQ